MKQEIEKSHWKSRKAKIINVHKFTSLEKWFDLQLENGELNHRPGQFVQVEIFGAGEIPLSVSSSPTKRGSFELCVRAAGRVSGYMHKLRIGDYVGVRGPFGRPFPIKKMRGSDLFFVAGGLGIVPLRSMINYAIDHRKDYGRIVIAFGCKTPQDLLFEHEIEAWRERTDIKFACTVDKSDPEWKGNIGLITSLIPGIHIDTENAYAIVVGPPVMYKFVIAELLKKNISEKKIVLSLERHMKCGMGKCGHCQIDHPKNYYCCKDGPTFTYNEIKDAAKL